MGRKFCHSTKCLILYNYFTCIVSLYRNDPTPRNIYICFVDRCLSLCTFTFGHCVLCSSSIYGLWIPLWCLETLQKIVLARLHVVDSDNLDEYKCLLLLSLFTASYNKTQSGKVYLMHILCKSQLFNAFILLCFSP